MRPLLLTSSAVAAFLTCGSLHAQSGPCADAAINRSFTTVILRPAHGSGNTGECNPANYGVHKDQASLDRAVVAYVNSHSSVPAQPAPAVYVDTARGVLMDHGTAIPLAQVNLISQDGGGLTPQQAQQLVASGGGNLVASGGGNLQGSRSLMSVEGKKTYVLKR